jgi:hypothetical protein
VVLSQVYLDFIWSKNKRIARLVSVTDSAAYASYWRLQNNMRDRFITVQCRIFAPSVLFQRLLQAVTCNAEKETSNYIMPVVDRLKQHRLRDQFDQMAGKSKAIITNELFFRQSRGPFNKQW